MLQELSFFLTLMLFPYLIAAVMPTWRWLFGCTLLFGGLITYGWVEHWVASQKPGYSEGPGGAIGIAVFMAVTVGFATGVAVRIVSLIVWWRGHRKGAFWIIAAGPLLPLAVLAAPGAWDQWRKRPAPESCVAAGFRVEVGDVRLSVPAAPVFTIYTGPRSARDAFYMVNVAMVRDLCSRTSNGAQPVRATNLGMRFETRARQNGAECATPPRPAGTSISARLCRRSGAAGSTIPVSRSRPTFSRLVRSDSESSSVLRRARTIHWELVRPGRMSIS